MSPLPGWQGTLNGKQKYPGLLDALACTQHLFWVAWVASALAELSTHQPSPPVLSGSSAEAWGDAPSHSQPRGRPHRCSASASQCLGTRRCTMLSLLFSPEKEGKLPARHNRFSSLKIFRLWWGGTAPEDCKGHSLSLCKTSSEVVGKADTLQTLWETCCNSASFLDNSVVFACVWKKLPFFTLTCLYKGAE